MELVADWIMTGVLVLFCAGVGYIVVAVVRAYREARAFDRENRERCRNPTPEEHAAWKARAWAETRGEQDT